MSASIALLPVAATLYNSLPTLILGSTASFNKPIALSDSLVALFFTFSSIFVVFFFPFSIAVSASFATSYNFELTLILGTTASFNKPIAVSDSFVFNSTFFGVLLLESKIPFFSDTVPFCSCDATLYNSEPIPIFALITLFKRPIALSAFKFASLFFASFSSCLSDSSFFISSSLSLSNSEKISSNPSLTLLFFSDIYVIAFSICTTNFSADNTNFSASKTFFSCLRCSSNFLLLLLSFSTLDVFSSWVFSLSEFVNNSLNSIPPFIGS